MEINKFNDRIGEVWTTKRMKEEETEGEGKNENWDAKGKVI